MERTYNPCDECPRGIDRRNGSGNDYACRNCEFAKLRALGPVEELSALVKARNEGPCGLCRYNPPSSCDGKPCTICPAEGVIRAEAEAALSGGVK